MIEEVKKHLKEVDAFSSKDAEAIEKFRLNYAGKKGILNELFAAFRAIPNEEKKAYGKELSFKAHRYVTLSAEEKDTVLEFSIDKTIDSPKFNELFSVKRLN